ncbi:chemotaxis protein CheB [Actinoplanes siamensis]|uniref:protein-glutamate methylesterase n=1 Tax=Actinoplanes siamensis TaxID=1223317 RepID=A0A919TK72_9ACTN|nr:chemotaxis protein CheB [Actinoplanes siamensis]GIF04915.1 hypothetical protein Asi03nite_24530 [Actinoplanes siamensis]
MPVHDVVTIGASAGGVHALRHLVSGLPAGLPASVLIVVHRAQRAADRLPDVLGGYGVLPAAHAVCGQRLTPGLLTVAPPGRHLVVTAGDVLRLHRGPLVHGARPAVDTLLYSAAGVLGPRLIAVVLSGMLSDGADGAAAVAAAGGTVLVQDPADADCPQMPQAVLDRVPGARRWPAAELGPALIDLIGRAGPSRRIAAEPWPAAAGDVERALWLAVVRLQAHAAVQQGLARQLRGTRLTGGFQHRADDALSAANLITSHVLPWYTRNCPAPGELPAQAGEADERRVNSGSAAGLPK